MSDEATTLSGVCSDNLLHLKWLLAPSHRVGHQWIEALVRNGQSVVNLRPTTVLRLAIDIVGFEMAEDGLTLASRSVGPLDAIHQFRNRSEHAEGQSIHAGVAVSALLLCIELLSCLDRELV